MKPKKPTSFVDYNFCPLVMALAKRTHSIQYSNLYTYFNIRHTNCTYNFVVHIVLSPVGIH